MMRVRVIGSGNAFTSRVNASILIDEALLIDCGPTVPSQLFKTGTFPTEILLTYPHGDHVLGLPVYLLRVGIDNMLKGKNVLVRLWGSQRTLKVVEEVYRLTYGWGNLREWVEFHPAIRGDSGSFVVDGREVLYELRRHTDFTSTYVFRIGNLGYATDVSETPDDHSFYEGLDTLIHEFGVSEDHTPLKVVVEMAVRAGVKRLYLTHYPDGIGDGILEPYTSLFSDVRLLKEGDTFTVGE